MTGIIIKGRAYVRINGQYWLLSKIAGGFGHGISTH